MKLNISKLKAQVRMSETIAILFIFFILLVFGFVFYSKIEARNIIEQSSQIQDLKAVEVAQVFSFFPEIQCTKDAITTNNCFDILKLEAFNETQGSYRAHYYDKLLRSAIIIQEIYPPTNRTWIVYNNTNFVWSKKVATQMPIALFNATGDPTTNLSNGKLEYYSFGIIEVQTYS